MLRPGAAMAAAMLTILALAAPAAGQLEGLPALPASPGAGTLPAAPAPAAPVAPPAPSATLPATPLPATPLAAAPPALPAAGADALRVAEALVAQPPTLTDLQSFVIAAAAVAGVEAAPARYEHALGPGALEAAVLEAYDAFGLEPTPEQRAALHDAAEAVDPVLADATALVLFALAEAQRGLADVASTMTAEEYALLRACGVGGDPGTMPCRDPARAQALGLAYARNGRVLGFELAVLSAVEQALPALQQAARASGAPLARSSEATGVEDHTNIFSDPLRLVEIGSLSSDVYVGNRIGSSLLDAASQFLTIDLLGDDAYFNRAGGALPAPEAPALGDGVRATGDLEAHQQPSTVRFGFLASVALDLGGDDRYVQATGGQGSGSLGIGLLVDTAGDDVYEAASLSQGYAAAGLGLLLDAQGHDRYVARSRSQGHGASAGLGLLADLAGDDDYAAEVLAQGSGSLQGLGVLLDGAGDDRYAALASGTSASQGAGHLLGAGVLVDAAGDDAFSIGTGGRGFLYPAPAPWGLGLAAFLDAAGRDAYAGEAPGVDGGSWSQGSGGAGWDRLEDLGGATLAPEEQARQAAADLRARLHALQGAGALPGVDAPVAGRAAGPDFALSGLPPLPPLGFPPPQERAEEPADDAPGAASRQRASGRPGGDDAAAPEADGPDGALAGWHAADGTHAARGTAGGAGADRAEGSPVAGEDAAAAGAAAEQPLRAKVTPLPVLAALGALVLACGLAGRRR